MVKGSCIHRRQQHVVDLDESVGEVEETEEVTPDVHRLIRPFECAAKISSKLTL